MLSHLAAEEFHLYVVTNKRIVPTLKILDMLSWTGMFEGVYSPDFFSPPLNTKERVLLWAREAHGIKVNMGLYVGDREEDLKASNAGGTGFLGVQWGYGDWSDGSRNNVDLVSDVNELYQFIKLRAAKV